LGDPQTSRVDHLADRLGLWFGLAVLLAYTWPLIQMFSSLVPAPGWRFW
jgi:hypothetical protein